MQEKEKLEIEFGEGCRTDLLHINKLPFIDYPDCEEIIKEYLGEALKGLCKEPIGALEFPYVVPGAEYQDLWDWDGFFVSCSLPDEYAHYGKGAAQNFLSVVASNGKPTKKFTVDGYRENYSVACPIQAQYAYVMAARTGDFDWIKPYWENLKKIRVWFDTNTRNYRGYYFYPHFMSNCLDNNPQVYGRRNNTSGGIDLVCWHYREIMAMYKLALKFEPQVAEEYKRQAEEVKKMINEQYWDKMDGCFYAIDCGEDFFQKTSQDISWNTYLKFRSCTCHYPLWAGAATPEHAKRIRDLIMSEDEFLSPAGVRSHSKADPVYNNVAMEDPSNWQGPVWGITSFMAALGLARYGYKQDALEICRRMNTAFANDIKENGCFHEHYHGETGQPMIRPGFISWNALAYRVAEDIRNGIDCTTYDMLD